MKALELQNLETIFGGDEDRSAFIDGLCVGAGIATLIAPNPVSATIAGACIVREAYYFWN